MTRQGVDCRKKHSSAEPIGWQVWGSLALISLLACAGCGKSGDKYPRVLISGTVKLDGQPLMKGYFIFEPKENQPTQSGGMIRDGKFDVPRESGPIPGKYSVAIFSGIDEPSGGAEPGTPEGDAATKKIRGERVPKKFNINTTLIREVVADGRNEFDFDLSSK
jgi:hypothetical protein